MDDYLQSKCNIMGINLIYTNNKIKILSSNVINGMPTLRVHKMFNKCNVSVADAIIGYYDNDNLSKDNYKIIENYIINLHPNLTFMITSPNKLFKDILKSKKVSSDSSDITEMKILSISQKSFMNNEIKFNNEIIVGDEDVLELDICIEPFNT